MYWFSAVGMYGILSYIYHQEPEARGYVGLQCMALIITSPPQGPKGGVWEGRKDRDTAITNIARCFKDVLA